MRGQKMQVAALSRNNYSSQKAFVKNYASQSFRAADNNSSAADTFSASKEDVSKKQLKNAANLITKMAIGGVVIAALWIHGIVQKRKIDDMSVMIEKLSKELEQLMAAVNK